MVNDDPYEQVARSKLKLKGDLGIKKKKKKDKKLAEKVSQVVEAAASSEPVEQARPKQLQKTKAEMAFKKMQEKNQTKRILEKANLTHKERVEKFNQHLDSLTEHFDIPKVSWTK